MNFKKYLEEMPYFDERFKVNCPMGDVVDGSNEEYQFDFGIEEIPKEERHLLADLNSNFGMLSPGIKKGIFPIYCKKHNLLFLYDFEKQEAVKPRTNHDMKMLTLVKQGILGIFARPTSTENITDIKLFT